MKQYLIGIDKKQKDILIELINLGGTLLHNSNGLVVYLNEKIKYDKGCWLLYTDVFPDQGINEIKNFLGNKKDTIEYEVIFYQNL